ncbi:MAG: hypothetical protein AABY64_13535 [Bdellovibrionota bacterium]
MKKIFFNKICLLGLLITSSVQAADSKLTEQLNSIQSRLEKIENDSIGKYCTPCKLGQERYYYYMALQEASENPNWPKGYVAFHFMSWSSGQTKEDGLKFCNEQRRNNPSCN